LPSDVVFYLGLAPDGAVWACTSEGLARFDGQNWTTLNSSNSGLPSDVTTRVAFDKAGGMYVAYPSSVMVPSVAELRGGVWAVLQPLQPPVGQNFNYLEPDAFIVDSKNRLWFSEFYNAGVFRYDPMLVGAKESAAKPALFSVAPNPTTGRISIQMQTLQEGDAQIQICNSLGQPIYYRTIPESTGAPVEVDLSRQPAGVYWVNVSQGGGVSTVRVLRQ
jgi:hypothetical protein